MVANGTHFTNKPVSGDATISNTGALTIGNNKISTAKIIDDAITTDKIAADQVTYAKIQNVSADERILGRVSGATVSYTHLTLPTNC